ncbi:hypothetical protein J6590_073709 [Homalodisca vitripennis]|nr:hypothetical protein J6590_073709 [Homalodisca vitripennis]
MVPSLGCSKGFEAMDRDKGVSKIHLVDTVEEMKKLNARRRLKGAVMAAVSSPKWASDSGDPDHFSDYGEDEVTSAAVSMVLDSLDDIHCLQEPPLDDREFLQAVLEDRQLHALLELEDRQLHVARVVSFTLLVLRISVSEVVRTGANNEDIGDIDSEDL